MKTLLADDRFFLEQKNGRARPAHADLLRNS